MTLGCGFPVVPLTTTPSTPANSEQDAPIKAMINGLAERAP
jgi:hypothetical protein